MISETNGALGAAAVNPAAAGTPPDGIARRMGLAAGLIFLSVILLGVLLNGIPSAEKLSRLWSPALGQVRWMMLAAALAAHLGSLALEAVQLKFLSTALDRPAGILQMLRIYLVGNLVAQITPSAMGGEPAQVYFLMKDGYALAESAFLLTLRAFLSVLARLVLVAGFGVIAVPSRYWPKSATWNALAITAGIAIIAFYVVLFLLYLTARGRFWFARIASKIPFLVRLLRCRTEQDVRVRIAGFADQFRKLMMKVGRDRGKILAGGVLISGLTWLAAKSAPFFIMLAFAESPSWPVVVTVGIMAQIAAAWVPTPGSVGATEAAMAAFFFPLVGRGDPAVLIPLFVLLFRIFEFPLNLLVAAPLCPGLFRSGFISRRSGPDPV